MFYIIYKTTNIQNGKFYIGSHKTTDLNDGYMGSGKYLTRAIERHGVENFQREILHIFDNPHDMYAKEAELVSEEMIMNENTYNLKKGGFGGWDFINADTTSRIEKNRKARLAANESMKEKYGDEFTTIISSKGGKTAYELHGVNQKWFIAGRTSMLGKKHSEETKQKMRLARQGKVSGSNNPHYGKMWITNGVIEQRIPKESVIPKGWYRGRTKK